MTRRGRIDVHSHLLPGMDDGCSTVAESLECARLMVSAGFSAAFCTPHIQPAFPGNNIATIPAKTTELQRELTAKGIPLQPLPGGEIGLRPELMEVAPEEIVSYALNGQYILVDAWCDEPDSFPWPVIQRFQSLGLKVILAHPERMGLLHRHPQFVEQLLKMDLLLQGNLQYLSGPIESSSRKLAERYLMEDRYFLLGTDVHALASLPGRLDGLERALEIAGAEMVDKLTIRNPQLLLSKGELN